MANAKFNLKSELGGVTTVTTSDAANSGTVVFPESGKLATTENIHGFKNYIINGNFDVWQRGTIFTVDPDSVMYTSDRWIVWNRSNQPVTVEMADNKGLSNLGVSPRMRLAYGIAPTTGEIIISQKIEGVKRLSSKTFTGSFYHSTLETLNISTYSCQNYGTGGSIDTFITNGSQATAGDLSFKRYSATFNIPDLKDKTIGNSSWVDFTIVAPIRTKNPLSIAQVQLEEGSVATPFEQRPYGLELSLCQRYYEVVPLSGATNKPNWFWNYYKVGKRVVPTLTLQGSSAGADYQSISIEGFRCPAVTLHTTSGDFRIAASAEL